MAVWYRFPDKTAFGRVLPKEKIYTYANPSRAVRNNFVSQVQKIVWQYKLAPETINLPARSKVPEIQIFDIHLKEGDLDEAVLRCIDKAIPFPIFYRLMFQERFKVMAAYKRPSEADAAKWVVDGYYATDWLSPGQYLTALPVALDLAALYEQMLRQLMPLPPRQGETLRAQAERIDAVFQKQKECRKLETRMQREKQFNRKVELNIQLRELKQELEQLTTENTENHGHG